MGPAALLPPIHLLTETFLAMVAKAMRRAMKKAGMKKAAMKKAMKKKSISKVARGRMAKAMVLRGSKAKTVGGLKASDLTKNKRGKIVSKKMAARGKKSAWIAAVAKARTALKVKGFCPCGGKTAQGKALLAKAKTFYKK